MKHMKSDHEKNKIVLPAVLAGCLLLFLMAGGSYFAKYLQQQIFEERTTQLNEITSQVRENLNNALNFQWNYLTIAVNTLEERAAGTAEDMAVKSGELEQTLETASYHYRLMLMDSRGH